MTVLTLTSDYIFNHMNSESGGHLHNTEKMSIGTTPRRSSSSSSSNGGGAGCAGAGASKSSSSKRPGKRPGRKPSKIDEHAKLERSRQSARECRARKKLRYQYLEELVLNREKAVFALRDELETYQQWCEDIDTGDMPEALTQKVAQESADLMPSSRPLTPTTQVDFSSVTFDRQGNLPGPYTDKT